MNNTPKFFPNLWGDLQGNLDTAKWTAVTTAWNEKKYLDSFYNLLDYINPNLRKKYGDASQTSFSVPHGSVVVNITLANDSVNIHCPMVDIAEANRIPLLRKAAEINFYPMVLAQMKLHTNQLSFYYSSTLNTCEPFKTYYALKEICITADRYDDEFKEKFKAKSLVEPKVHYPTTDEIDKAWENTNAIITETFEFIVYFDSQRWFGSSLDYLVMALKRIDLCVQIQGFLKSELERVNGELSNGKININDRTATGKKFLLQIQQAGKESFVKNLYHSETFIPVKWRTSNEQIKSSIQNAYNQVLKFHNEKSYIASVIEAHYCMYDLFYKNNMDHAINNILLGSLTNAAEKPWMEASAILLGGLQTINATVVVSTAN